MTCKATPSLALGLATVRAMACGLRRPSGQWHWRLAVAAALIAALARGAAATEGGRGSEELRAARRALERARTESLAFDTDAYARHLDAGLIMAAELEQAGVPPMHIVVRRDARATQRPAHREEL